MYFPLLPTFANGFFFFFATLLLNCTLISLTKKKEGCYNVYYEIQ